MTGDEGRRTRRQARSASARATDLRSSAAAAALVLTLARPDRRNSLSEAMLARAAGGDRRGSARCRRARGRDRRQGHRLLRRSRPEGADRASRAMPTAGAPSTELLMRQCSQADAVDRALPQAGDRGRAGHGDGGRLPAGRDLRSGGGGRGGDVLHAGRQHRPVLLDADGGAVAQRAAQAGHGDAAAGRDAAGARRRPSTASSTAWCRPTR